MTRVLAHRTSLSAILFSLLLALSSTVLAQHQPPERSVLWENKSSGWNPEKLPDFTNVGYGKGAKEIPFWPVGVNVTDTRFGAIPNDGLDDTAAFNKAIMESPEGHAVFIPNGTYIISDYIHFDRDNVVLRGEDRGKTTLFFPIGLRDIYGDEQRWQFDGGFITSSGGKTQSLENFTIKFPETQFEGHFSTLGTRAIEFSNVTNSWIRSLLSRP